MRCVKVKAKTCGIFHSFAGHWQLIAEDLGLETLWYYENEPKTREIVEHNRPELPIIDEITDITQKVDVVMGSPPCVGISQANPKSCPDHPANTEMLYFANTVSEIKPNYFFMEMVPSINQERFKGIYKALVNGFLINHKVLVKTFNFMNYEVPQNRQRTFFYGSLNNYLAWPKPMGETNIRQALEGLENYSKEYAIENKLAVEMKPHWKGPYSMLVNNPEYFNLKWDGVSKVITALGSGYLRHPDQHRRITYREAARFMEFPDDWDFSIHSLSQIFRDIGWGVPIKGTAKIVRKLLDYDGNNDGSYEKIIIQKSVGDFF